MNIWLAIFAMAAGITGVSVPQVAAAHGYDLTGFIQEGYENNTLLHHRSMKAQGGGETKWADLAQKPQIKKTEALPAQAFGKVYPVQSNLVVRGEPRSDIQLETAVMEAIRTNALTADGLIVAHVTKGEVTLEGSVLNPMAKREATRLAETVLGINSIRNRLDVAGDNTAQPLPAPSAGSAVVR